MRRRLIITYVTLLAAVVVGFNLPLAITIAGHEGHQLFFDRLGDTVRFASLAEPPLRASQLATLYAELRRHDEEFGMATAIVTRDRQPVAVTAVSWRGIDLSGGPVAAALDRALAGQPARFDHTIYPWHDQPLVVAEPIRRDGEVVGAVVTVSSTEQLRAAILRRWSAQAAASLLVLLAGVGAAWPLTSWMLRPVRRLDRAVHGLAAGRFPGQALPGSGPPELRRLTASFNAMADRLAVMVERQRSFASYASHQLRTPLATLRLWVDNLASSVLPAGREDHRLVAEEIDRLGEMCEALLAYAQAEATAGDVTELDAAEVADARVAVWSQAARQAGVNLARAGGWRAFIRAAPQALDQALDALLSNAIKFVGRGNQVVVAVDAVLRVDGAGSDWVDIHVIDNGPGMPVADLARATQPFWRGPDHRNLAGSGLGVTIADELVRASGGRLDLMPAQPVGLHARIRLPAAKAAAGTAAA